MACGNCADRPAGPDPAPSHRPATAVTTMAAPTAKAAPVAAGPGSAGVHHRTGLGGGTHSGYPEPEPEVALKLAAAVVPVGNTGADRGCHHSADKYGTGSPP